MIREFISGVVNDHKLRRGDFDAPIEGDIFIYKCWKCRPRGTDCRIVRYQDGRLGLQSLVGEEWSDVECYDDGWFDESKIHAGRWRRLSDDCAWSMSGLEKMRESILDIVKEPVVVSSKACSA